MIHILLWGLALVFAIPTFGISLLVCYLFFNWMYKLATPPILEAMHDSFASNEVIELKATNSAVIKKAFKLLHVEDFEVQYYPSAKLKTFVGEVHHPKHANPLLVQIHAVTGEKTITVSTTCPIESPEVIAMNEMMDEIKEEMKEKHRKDQERNQ